MSFNELLDILAEDEKFMKYLQILFENDGEYPDEMNTDEMNGEKADHNKRKIRSKQ